ncbi:hypothetical protein HUJ04_001303 [Dendroctonus ponderosae]|uniref:Uncharacterized protein n=1 Tax=Dendroctonus ponderosae TaxID=77166 RepID=A0AAR5Q5D0_DENPD|nr:hypothetical protein HUJ04_001303 [Dendroctonus ponderosae]
MLNITGRCVLLLSCAVFPVQSLEKTSVYMKRSEVSDQKMSGSGYSYNGEDQKPQEYSFELDGGNDAVNIVRDLGFDPFADSLESHAAQTVAVPYFQEVPSKAAKIPLKPVAFALHDNSQLLGSQIHHLPTTYPHIDQYGQLGILPQFPYAPGFHHDLNSNFVKSGGKIYDDLWSKQIGDKFDSGYNVVDAYSKGLSGSFDDTLGSSFSDQTGAKSLSVFDNAANYGLNQAAGKAALGGSFGQKDGHNRGSKTTGYQKVYHKDDYDKQHKFYDKADRRGHFNKYGDFKSAGDSGAGHFVKGGLHTDGQNANKYGVSDVSDKGHFDDFAKGFNKANGQEGYFQDYAGYSNKAGKASSGVAGFSG